VAEGDDVESRRTDERRMASPPSRSARKAAAPTIPDQDSGGSTCTFLNPAPVV
jgi:hypothetical protein